MKKTGLLGLALIMVMILALVAGCTATPAASTDAASEPEAAAQPAEAAAEPAADDPVVIGMVVRDVEAPFEQALIHGVQAGCDKYGYQLKVQDGKGDTLIINEMIDTYIMEGVDAFIMCGANDLKGVVPGIEKLNEAGIPVYALDSCPEGGHIETYITFNNTTQSARATEVFLDGIRDRNNGEVPEGVIIYITGSLTDVTTELLSEGFYSVINETTYPQLTVAEGEGKWNNEDTYERTAELLARYGDEVLGIYVQTPDIMGMGAVRAVETAGLDPVNYGICGIHIGPEFMELIKEGKVLACVEFTAVDNGLLTVEFINDKLTGVPYPEIGSVIEEENALWSPAKVSDLSELIEGATGLYVDMNGPFVPTEVSADDERLWENQVESW